jgi:cytochrome c oxidase subunit II
MSPLQSAFAAHGPEAEAVLRLTIVMTVGAAMVLGLVVVLVALALRAPRPWLARPATIAALGIALPVVTLTALVVYATLAVPRPYTAEEPAVRIELVGHQWWWEVRYLGEGGTLDFTTANEMRVPAGRPVEVSLASADVLHSFWVPSLAGKLDLVPGRRNVLLFAARDAGTYRGQCAEYCGGPHGLMALHVVAGTAAEFESWRSAQRLAAPPPRDPGALRGKAVFEATCGACHTIRGTAAAGTLGPDLTHVASRTAIAAGTLANDAAARARWITASQHVKPGNLMPEFRQLPAGDLEAVGAYLGTLR